MASSGHGQEAEGVTHGRDDRYAVLGLLSRGVSRVPAADRSPSSPPEPPRPAPRTDTAAFSFPTLLKFPELLTRSRELVPIQQFI